MTTQIQTTERDPILVQTTQVRPIMGIDVLEPVPGPNVPYELSDPFILVHEAKVPVTEERAKLDTTHPHRGFDNLRYILSGSSSAPSGLAVAPTLAYYVAPELQAVWPAGWGP